MPEPGYWTNETTGILRPAVENYLCGRPLLREHVEALRAYFRQWTTDANLARLFNAPGWEGARLAELRSRIDAIHTRRDIEQWLKLASQGGYDPL